MLSCAYWKSLLFDRPQDQQELWFWYTSQLFYECTKFFGFFNAEEPKSYENQFLRLQQNMMRFESQLRFYQVSHKKNDQFESFLVSFFIRILAIAVLHFPLRIGLLHQDKLRLIKYNTTVNKFRTMLLNFKNDIGLLLANFNIVRRHLWMWNILHCHWAASVVFSIPCII